MKSIKVASNASLCALLVVGFYSNINAFSQDYIPLQFESNIFPDSPYNKVHGLCIDLWQHIRTGVTAQNISKQCVSDVDETMMEFLFQLRLNISDMFADPRSCSPDDLEYIMELLELMHREYIQKNNHPGVLLLFDYIKKIVNSPLVVPCIEFNEPK